MKRKALNFFNLLLGVLATVFAGCHIHKKVAPEPEPVCIYAGPGQMGELNVRTDSVKEEDAPPVPNEYIPSEEMQDLTPTPVKYGPRPE